MEETLVQKFLIWLHIGVTWGAFKILVLIITPDHLNQNFWEYKLGISSASQTLMCLLIIWVFAKIQINSLGLG